MGALKKLEEGKIYYFRASNRTFVYEMLFRLDSPGFPLTKESKNIIAILTILGDKPHFYNGNNYQKMNIILKRLEKKEVTITKVPIKDLPLYIYLETTP